MKQTNDKPLIQNNNAAHQIEFPNDKVHLSSLFSNKFVL